MDTTEELNCTYFYAGRPNLTAGELFFMILCEEVAAQLGVEDSSAIVAILSGRNVLTTRAKPRDVEKGTSYASRAARRVFRTAKFPFSIQLPTVVGGYPPWTARIRWTHKLSTFGMDSDQVMFSRYYPRNPREAIPLTINMLVESVRAGRWCYK